MIIQHREKRPQIHELAYIAPNATISGDVSIGANTAVMFGAVITSEGGPVEIGSNCVIMENAVIRGTKRHPAKLGNHILVGPRSYLSGCTIENSVFLATGATIFNGAHVEEGSTIRINGILHIKSRLPKDTVLPINWIAVGNPAKLFSPDQHDEIWEIQKELDFPGEVFGMSHARGRDLMPKMTSLYCNALQKHKEDREI